MEILDLFRVMGENDSRITDVITEYSSIDFSKGGSKMGVCSVVQDWVDEGINQGMKTKAIDAAVEALREKIAPETVAKIVKLPLEEVLELQKQVTVTA